MIAGIDHVQVAAPAGCEAQGRAFYGELLGLAEIEKLRGRGGLWFQCGLQQLHVGVEENFSPGRKAHPALAVGAGGLDALAERLEGDDVAVIWDEAIPDLRRFYTADPWGNRLELVEVAGT